MKKPCLMAWAVGLSVSSACTASSPRPAPSLLSPAPAAAAAVSPYGNCPILPVRAQTVSGDGLLNALGPFVPTWLPQGFGLVVGWRSDSSPGGGAIWTDAQCRRITLEIHPSAVEGGSPPPDSEWRVAERGHCIRDEIRIPCVSYDVRADGDVLLVQTEDLAENVARQFLAGIDVTS